MIIAARDISVTLGRRTVIDRLGLAISPGALTAIIGPNGAGKSTCLRALAGLVPATRGEIVIGGRPLAGMSLSERARAIGYLPQQRIAHWPLTVERTVGLGRVPHATGADENAAAIDKAMTVMDVARFRDRTVGELSGGELARVLMARVLAQETPVILADEPIAGLDPAHQITLMQSLATLADNGRTVVVAIHDLWLAARYCPRLVLIKDGAVFADGSPAAVLTPAVMKSAFGIEARIDSLGGVPVVLPVGLC